MRIEHHDDASMTVYLRQSWINDALNCQERGRRMIVEPELRTTSDSAAIGTAVHAGIESAINGHDPLLSIAESLGQMLEEGMTMTLNMSRGQMLTEAIRMFDMWVRDIRPKIGQPLHTEYTFDVEWFTTQVLDRKVNVRLKGTIDLITTTGLWDWKTAGRKYQAREKQNTAIQPTVYAIAGTKLGFFEWPVTFNYGLMVRGKDDTQILSVHRTRNHEVWLARVVEPLIRQAIGLGTDMTWPINDSHALCSQKWCPWWTSCKGSALTSSDLYTKE